MKHRLYRLLRITFLILLVAGVARTTDAAPVYDTDICVYGGTSGGIAAAVQASRQGKSVAMTVFSQHLGGLTSGGLGATDVGTLSTIGGVSREFYQRAGQKYGQTERFNFEPKVARQVFSEMLTQAGVTPRYDQRLASVAKTGQRITSITMEDGTEYRARMFIDATYEGDLLAMAGVTFTVGREAVAQFGESLNGIRATTPSHQFVVNVDPYVIPGDAGSGLLPLVQPGNGGTPGDGDSRIQAYNYRLCFTQNAANRLPHAVPPDYDPARYELLGRYLDARVAAGHTLTMGSFFNISGMPNGKTDMNNNGAISTDYIGMNYAYPNAGYAARAALDAEHLHYIQGLVHYLATSPRSPASLKAEVQSWGPTADEWTATGGYSPQLYIREARRMVSDYVMTQGDCQATRAAADPVCQGSYNMDSHNCQRIVAGGFARNEGDVQQSVPAPYGISYRSLIPAAGQTENLLVTFAISATHIAFGSTRMEPVCMMAGQAGAAAACFAIDDNVSVQQVNYAKLAHQLRADKQVLPAPPGSANAVIIDNPQATFTGAWTASTSTAGFYGANYHHDGNLAQGAKSARYTPTLAATGDYDVFLRWTAFANRSAIVPVDIIHAGGTTTVSVNQQLNNGVWMKLGTWNFLAGTAGSLLIRTTGANGFVVADAAQFTPAAPAPPPVVEVIASDSSAREFSTSTPDRARFTIVRSGDTSPALTVNLTAGGSATPGTDYSTLPATVVMAAGQTSAVLEITAPDDSLPEGDESLILTVQSGGSYTVGPLASASAVVHDAAFDEWRLAHFTAAQLADDSISGATADPDGDGTDNLLEFWLGRSPSQTEAPPSLVILPGDFADVVEVVRHRDAAELFLQVQHSTDLLTWGDAAAEGSPITVTEELPMQRIHILIAGIPPEVPRSFLRLAVSAQPFAGPAAPARAFFSFDTLTDGTGGSTLTGTAVTGFPAAPVIDRAGTIFVVEGGAASFTDFTGATWLGSGGANVPGHCLGWNPGSTGNRFSLTFSSTGLNPGGIRMDIRSAAAAGGTPPAGFNSFTYDTGAGPQPVPGATLTFPADNTFHEWSVNLSALTALANRPWVVLTWTFDDLANTPSPIESFRIDNIQLTAEP